MSPRERAQKVVDFYAGKGADYPLLVRAIEEALRETIEESAALAEFHCSYTVARAIRALGAS